MSEPASANPAPGPPDVPPFIPDHELLRQIGKGSYGEVWLARSSLGTYRAVKIVHRAALGNERPYEREFTGLKNFEPISRGHEGVVDILQVGRNDAASYFYYVMELAEDAAGGQLGESEGESGSTALRGAFSPATYVPLTLETKIRSHGRLPVTECVRIATTLADALRYLHQNGLVHRDIKPSNIIFVGGVPKLADVGLVARTDSAQTFVGTEGYIPVEGPGTPSADIYSLGKCLYEMAMGKDRQAYPSPPTLLDELPDRRELVELNEVITRACEHKRADRYEAAAAMHQELELLRTGRSVQMSRAQQRRQRLVKRVATVAISLLAISGIAFYSFSRPHLSVVDTLIMPAEWTSHSPLVGDWNGDGQSDLCLVGGNRVYWCSATGELMGTPAQISGNGAVLSGNLVADVSSGKSSALFLSWRDATNLHLGVFNQSIAEINHFTAQGATPRDSTHHYLSTLTALACADLKNDGHPAVIAALMTGHGGQPRDVRCYDYESSRLRWSYPVASFVNKAVTVDLNGDGALDLLCDSSAVSNGSKLADGTDDDHAYLYAISGEGLKLWTQKMGESYSHCEPLIFENRNWLARVYAVVSRGEVQVPHADSSSAPEQPRNSKMDPTILPSLGYIVQLDGKDGRQLRRYTLESSVNGMLVADLNGDDKPKLLVTDGEGWLHVLDLELNLVAKRRIVPRLYDRVKLTLVAVADLDGDGQQELLFTASQQRAYAKESMIGLKGKPQPRHSLDNCVLVFSADLKPLAKHVLADEWEVWRDVYSTVLNVPGQRHKSIVVMADKVHFLRYSRR